MVNLIIDGKNITVENGITILEAARSAGINIPTLCYLKDRNRRLPCMCCRNRRQRKPLRRLQHTGRRRYGNLHEFSKSENRKENKS